MLNRTQIIKILNNADWGNSDLQRDLPQVAFMLRSAVAIGYYEELVSKKENQLLQDNLYKNSKKVTEYIAAKVGQKVIEAIPVIGDVLSLIFSIGGIDLSALGSISDSGTARQRLIEWLTYLEQNYYSNNSSIGGYEMNNLLNFFKNNVNSLIPQRPKCVSPTSGCSKEHQLYIAKTSVVKEAQSFIIQFIEKTLNSDDSLKEYYIYTGKDTKSNLPEPNKGSIGALPLLAIASLFLIKKG